MKQHLDDIIITTFRFISVVFMTTGMLINKIGFFFFKLNNLSLRLSTFLCLHLTATSEEERSELKELLEMLKRPK